MTLGATLHESWVKKELSKCLSEFIDSIYSKAIKNGAIGGKILGAGEIGLFCVEKIQSKNLNITLRISQSFLLSLRKKVRNYFNDQKTK